MFSHCLMSLVCSADPRSDGLETAQDLANVLNGVVRTYRAKKDARSIGKKITTFEELMKSAEPGIQTDCTHSLEKNAKTAPEAKAGSILKNQAPKQPNQKQTKPTKSAKMGV